MNDHDVLTIGLVFFLVMSVFVVTTIMYDTSKYYLCSSPGYSYSSVYGLSAKCVYSESKLQEDYHPSYKPNG